MVLIVSDNLDFSTSEIMKWLVHFNKEVIRINGGEIIEHIEELSLNDFTIQFKGHRIKYEDISTYWYRRGLLNIDSRIKANESVLSSKTSQYLQNEKKTTLAFIEVILSQKAKICDFFSSDVNKLIVLRQAHLCDLLVPDMVVTQCKQVVEKFKKKNKTIITKVIDKGMELNTGKQWLPMYTHEVSGADMKGLTSEFFPGIFQKNIIKKYELRIFYLCGKFYSMAIFSQRNKKTQTDFRQYDLKKPNKQVPFKLPIDIEEKLRRLMQSLRLKTGSIDMMVDKLNNFYFLEVNPIGQFGMTSYPCNYHLEKEIATILAATN